jgi:hypothetical protein
MKIKYLYKPKYSTMTVKQIKDDIRRDWMSYSKKHAAIQERAERVQLENGRHKTLIRCCGCNGLFLHAQVHAHHLKPVGTLESSSREDVEAYMRRMFCHKNDIQPLCVECHNKAHAGEEFDFEIEETTE